MKKTFHIFSSILLFLLFCLLLCACSNPPSTSSTIESDSLISDTEIKNTPLTLNLAEYQMIKPSGASFELSASVSLLQDELHKSDLNLSLKTDQQVTCEKNAKEILIGATNRPESKEALASLPKDQGFGICFTETKIVIVARTPAFLSEAVQAFIEEILSQRNGTSLTIDTDFVLTGAPCFAFPLVENAEPRVRLVCSLHAHETVKEGARAIVNRIQSLTSVDIPMVDEYENPSDLKEIVVGQLANDEESKSLLSQWNVNEYGLHSKNGRIFILGHTFDTTADACSLLVQNLQYAEQVTDSQSGEIRSLTVYLPEQLVEKEADWFGDYPHFQGGLYDQTYDCGNNIVQMRYTAVEPNHLTDYISELEAEGFIKKQDNQNNGETGNRFVTLLGEKGLLHLSYFAFNQALTVASDPLTKTVYYETDEELPAVQEQSTLAVMTLDYSKHPPVNGCDPRLNDGGLSYVITLRDGRYIVIDGGWNNSDGTHDCDILYEFMFDRTKLADENGNKRIVIAAWIFTHDSPDHHEAFLSFASKYCKTDSIVTLQHTVYNMGVESQYSQRYRTGLVTQEPILRSMYFPDCTYIQPHTGQKITFGDIEFEFLYTLEALAPDYATDANDASMIFRMTINGMTTLFTGDAITHPCDLTAKLYGSYARSDVMQINHHGTAGLTVGLYNCVTPLYSLWTTSETCFAARTAGKTYPVGFPVETTAKLNVRIITELNEKHGTNDISVHTWYADGPIEILSFSPDKKITVLEIYTVNPDLLPERPSYVE